MRKKMYTRKNINLRIINVLALTLCLLSSTEGFSLDTQRPAAHAQGVPTHQKEDPAHQLTPRQVTTSSPIKALKFGKYKRQRASTDDCDRVITISAENIEDGYLQIDSYRFSVKTLEPISIPSTVTDSIGCIDSAEWSRNDVSDNETELTTINRQTCSITPDFPKARPGLETREKLTIRPDQIKFEMTNSDTHDETKCTWVIESPTTPPAATTHR